MSNEEHLENALTEMDVQALLTAISEPEWDTAERLTQAYVRAVHQNPPSASGTTEFLVDKFLKSDELPKIPLSDDNDENIEYHNFSEVFYREVFETIRDIVYDDSDVVINPKNHCLANAVLSGACMATKLVHCSAQNGAIQVGLNIDLDPQDGPFDANKDEIRAIQACLHVLMVGKSFAHHRKVASALQTLKDKGTVVNENGGQLLEATIIHVQNGYPRKLSSSEVWKILFHSPNTKGMP